LNLKYREEVIRAWEDTRPSVFRW